MIEKMKALSRKLKEAFPNGYVAVNIKVMQYSLGEEGVNFYLGISEISVHENYKTWEALDHDAHFLLSKQAMGVYDDDLCDIDIVSQAEEIKNMSAPWNEF